ncbi:hypothetical protein [Streptomyces lavendulae]|uniref:hypothetical protein n=1 Tax=Streptomyces lavendulae TaxID=1914 RepID=UPI0037FD4574
MIRMHTSDSKLSDQSSCGELPAELTPEFSANERGLRGYLMPEISRRRVALAVSALTCFGAAASGTAVAAPSQTRAANYLYTSIGEFDTDAKPLLGRPDIDGVQVVVPWGMLETDKNHYDFSAVDRVVREAESRHKKVFIQVQDRFFEPPARVPRYLLVDPEYGGGVTPQLNEDGPVPGPPGSVAAQWNKNVQNRFQRLLKELAQRFDGKVDGVNLPESSVSIDVEKDTTHFTCDAYFNAELENAAYAKKVFKRSAVVQYINFWPCGWGDENGYMKRSFEFAEKHGVGVGGPDLLPYNKPHMNNAYRYLNQYRGKFPLVAMAVQEPDFEYTSPVTGKPYTKQEFIDFANDYLGADIVFWATSSPWLQQKAAQ